MRTEHTDKLRLVLYAIAFFANAAVLVFEIAGSRMLAPYLGTSTEVWSSLIAVILGGLAVGYWVGGRFAARELSRRQLAWFLYLGAIAAFCTWILKDIAPTLVFLISPALPLAAYSAITASILFLPATIFLGAVSPYTVRLAIEELSSAGPTIGNFSAIGAAGSILGALATGTVLLPTFRLDTILLGVAIALALLGAVASGISRSRIAFLAFLVVGAAFVADRQPRIALSTVVADIDTAYNRVWILDATATERPARYLLTDPFGTQCGMYLGKGGFREDELVFSYLKGFAAASTLVAPQKALMLGGCNYSFPRYFLRTHPDAVIDVVEIDPGMTEIARDWFELRDEPRLRIRHEDARIFLSDRSDRYDVIYLDTYNSFSSIPFQLSTKEFFESARETLERDGILIANVIGAFEGAESALPASLYKTMRDVFPAVTAYRIGKNPDEKTQNIIFVASSSDTMDAPERVSAHGAALSALPRETVDAFLARGHVLTDDFAPVEKLTKPIREKAIKEFASRYLISLTN